MLRSELVKLLRKQIGGNYKETCDYLGYPVGQPWCLAGVIMFFSKYCKIELPRNYSNSRFQKEDWTIPKLNHSYSTAQIGDIIQYEWNPENNGTIYDDGADHVGIVYDVIPETQSLKVIEWNFGTNSDVNNTIGIRTITWNSNFLDAIIDMSSFFEDDEEEKTDNAAEAQQDETDKLKEKVKELESQNAKLKEKSEAFSKIKEIVLENSTD